MSTSSSDSVYALGTSLQYINATNPTLAPFYQSVAGQNGWHIKYQSGGTLFIVGAPSGTTLPGTVLLGATAHYMFGTSEALDIGGPTNFYLVSLGATTLVNVIRTFSSGF